ncbi:MAG: hypothetical protein ABJF89_01350 [Parasphingorhabdus sp.]|uniref:hypothetical protein n=1 Tax=Parasphingorhabdus sp. TaxID=2709688 RepID=UPI003264247E
MSQGYSGTPLAKKLSLKDGMRVWFDGMPASVRAEINAYGVTLVEELEPSEGLHAAHIFTTERVEMEKHLSRLRNQIDPAGQVWVSWPKKASKVATDITEDTIRKVCLPMGFVDIKVCAVDSTWSALKLVIRKELR